MMKISHDRNKVVHRFESYWNWGVGIGVGREAVIPYISLYVMGHRAPHTDLPVHAQAFQQYIISSACYAPCQATW